VVSTLASLRNGGTNRAEGDLIVGTALHVLVEEILYREHGKVICDWLTKIVGIVDALIAGIDSEILKDFLLKKQSEPDFSMQSAITKLLEKEKSDA